LACWFTSLTCKYCIENPHLRKETLFWEAIISEWERVVLPLTKERGYMIHTCLRSSTYNNCGWLLLL
jgi:hypothetical protein